MSILKIKLNLLFLFLLSFCAMFLVFPKHSLATYYCGYAGGCEIRIQLTNPNNTEWQVHYVGANDDTGNVPDKSGTVWIPGNSSYSFTIEGIDYRAPLPNSAYVTWSTSCADPYVSSSNYTKTIIPKFDGGVGIYTYNFYSGCQSPTSTSCSGVTYLNAKYAACKYIPGGPDGRSGDSVGYYSQCPQTTVKRYCASHGDIYGIVGTYCAVLCNTGYQCDGVCHEEKQINTCSGSYCVNSSATRYNGSCTAGCCAYSSDPGTPTLNSPTGPSGLTCAGDNNPNNVTVYWSAAARATNYTVYYCNYTTTGCNSSGDWTAVDRNLNLSYTIPIPNANQGDVYKWKVKADNCFGSTTTGWGSFTVPDCHPPKGYLDGASCTPPNNATTHTTSTTPSFWGWTCQAYNYNTQLTVNFKDGTTLLGSTVANLSNESAVTTACGGSTVGHRFVFNAPASIINNTSHTIHAYATSQLSGSAQTELSSSPKTFGPCNYNITVNVYQDFNGNGVQDAGETGYVGAGVKASGPTPASGTTTTGGTALLSNLTPGAYTITLNPIPTGFTTTTTYPAPANIGPSTTVNIGIKPPAPTCAGGLTTQYSTRNPGQASILTCVSPIIAAQGGTITYSWLSPAPGSITSTNPSTTNTATWTAPSNYWTDTYAYPTVNVCQTGTTLCTPYGISNGLGVNNAGIHIVPMFTISGNVFVDQNKDGLQNGGDVNYTGAISVTSSGGTVSYPAPSGSYLVSNLPAGTYTISYSWPNRYASTNPKTNLRPATFTVTVGNASTGTPCTTNGALGAVCDANGNITTLRFGISNSLPWIQAISGDITGSSVSDPNGGGFSNPIPAGATCGTYTSLLGSVVGGGTTPGIVYSGAGSYDFGSGQASQNPYNWVVGGITYPDVYTPLTPGVIKTSYAYVSSIAKTSGITPTDISTYCGAGGLNSCQLPSNLPNGVYIANGDLTLSGPSYTFPSNKNFVVLVNGNLNLNTEIHVPVGSTATFTAANDITVAQTIGEATTTSTRANIEGYYSADKHFIINGVNSCPTTDLRLNVAGSIVVNAGLNSAASLATQANFVNGGFVNERDLCATDLQCPAFSIIERPDFIINAPDFFKTTRRVWREIAP